MNRWSKMFACTLLFVVALLLSACSASNGDKFIGNWVRVNNPKDAFIVEKAGDFYTGKLRISESIANIFEPTTMQFTDGRLEGLIWGEPLRVTYGQNTDSILVEISGQKISFSSEFQRSK